MGICINIDTYLLCSMFNINTKKLDTEYKGLSIEEIMEAEAKSGNSAAANFDSSVLNDPVKLIALFELKDPGNKFIILSNMNQSDLDNLLPLLNQDDLVQGLNYFSKDKLLTLIEDLPKEQLLNLTFDMFSEAHVMQMMPETELNKMLKSTDMDKQQEIKCLESVNPAVMAMMIQQTTGQKAEGVGETGLDGKTNFDIPKLVNQIASMPDNQFQDTILSMPKNSKQAFVYRLAQNNPKLYKEVSANTYTNMINQKKDKQDIIRSAHVIEPEQLVKMVSKLPKDLTAAVLTQIDTNKFANILISQFKGVLSQIMAC